MSFVQTERPGDRIHTGGGTLRGIIVEKMGEIWARRRFSGPTKPVLIGPRPQTPGPKMIRIQPEMFCSGGTITVHTIDTPWISYSFLSSRKQISLIESTRWQTNDKSTAYQVAMRSESYTSNWRNGIVLKHTCVFTMKRLVIIRHSTLPSIVLLSDLESSSWEA